MKLLPDFRRSLCDLELTSIRVRFDYSSCILAPQFFDSRKQLNKLFHCQLIRFNMLTINLVHESHLLFQDFTLSSKDFQFALISVCQSLDFCVKSFLNIRVKFQPFSYIEDLDIKPFVHGRFFTLVYQRHIVVHLSLLRDFSVCI